MKKLLLAFSVAACLTACNKKDDKQVAGIFKSNPAKFQHGKAWTWIEMDAENKPLKIGMSFDDEAMNSLDDGTAGDGGHQHHNAVSLKIPARSSDVPFQHIMLDWNPQGHEPAGIYDQPHFDFHFYTTSEAERKAIPTYEQDSVKFKNFPAAGYMPNLYVPIPGGVPQMGTHWIDVTSAELNGQPFTQTFIYGSYNGAVNFYEPMITKAFITANLTFERAIPLPPKFHTRGYYPTKMKLSKTAGATHITLENFVYKAAS